MFNIIYGLTRLFNDEALAPAGGRSSGTLTAWGWIHLILGIVLILTALGLFAGQEWARWAGSSS